MKFDSLQLFLMDIDGQKCLKHPILLLQLTHIHNISQPTGNSVVTTAPGHSLVSRSSPSFVPTSPMAFRMASRSCWGKRMEFDDLLRLLENHLRLGATMVVAASHL